MADQIFTIPKGWKMTTLGEVAEPSKSQWRPGDQDQKYLGLEHIDPNQLTINGFGSSSDLASNKFYFQTGDTLFGKLRPYFRKVWKAKFKGVCSTDIWVLKPKNNFDRDFLFYFVANPYFVNKSMGANIGTHMPRADWHFLETTEWAIPSHPEQRAIAAVLSSLDDKIELLREQNKTLEATAQAIFKEWFVNFNFPGATGKMIDSELGEIPEGWGVRRLSEIANFLNGLALQKFPAESDDVFLPIIKIKELTSGITSQTDKASAKLDKKYIVNDGDVLFSWSGSLVVDIWKYGKGALNQHLFKVTSDDYPKWFYFYWTKEHLTSFQQIAGAKAVTMGHIQRHHLDDALVVVPNDKFMKISDLVFTPIMEKFINNNSQIQILSKLRDTLLPKLMKGEVRVKGFKD